MRKDDREDVPPSAWHLHWKLPEFRHRPLVRAGEWEPKVRAYLATISFLDSQVGRLLKALRENDLEKNTLVVLWSDHGYHLGEKAITGKNSLWEPSTRVPLIFAGPGITVGGRCEEPVELLDVYPTLVKLCGLPATDQCEGHLLQPQLRDASTRRKRPAITTANPDNHSVRSRRHRYIRYADGSEEFYDLADDPHEFRNLIRDPSYLDQIEAHKRHLPRVSAPLAPGSRGRTLEWKDGKAIWEGQAIPKGAPIPGLQENP